MNNIYSVTKGIQDILRSDDWTNSPRRQEIAKEFSELSRKVSDLLDECRSLLEQGLGQEAASLAGSQEPSLSRQFELLNFDGLSDWRELCQIYEWSVPPKLDGEILEKLTVMSADAKNLQPLLNAYRMVARTEDVRAKVLLLRRLVRADAKSQEWRNMLLQQEEIWQKRLINEAKHAIIDKQYDSLQELLQKINDPEWSVKCPEQVTRKIEQVLEQHHLEELKKQAEKCLNSINEAYGNFEFDSLGAALGEWRDLSSLAGYQPDETEIRQVKEAEEYYLQQNKERNEEARFQALAERLRQGLENAAPQENLDMIYNQISLTGRQLPEHVEHQYLTIKENYDLI